MYERAFRLHGHDIEVTHDGATALQKLQSADSAPDAIVLDVLMPHMNGVELLKELRADPRFANVPVAILTNSFHKEDKEQFLAMGADLYLVKIEHQSKQIVAEIEALITKHRGTIS